MAAMRDAANGLSAFSKMERTLIWSHITYLFLIPAVSMISYELMLHQNDSGWSLGSSLWFFLPVIMHLGFTLNNLKVPGSTRGLWVLAARVPAEVVLMSVLFGWTPLYALSACYAFEILGFSVGLLTGTLLRKSDVSLAQRLVSMALAAGFLWVVYHQFEVLFQPYVEPNGASSIEIAAGLGCVIVAAWPYIQIFSFAKAGSGINMGQSWLIKKLSPALGIGALFYLLGVPAIIQLILMVWGE